MAKIFMLSF